eukprot:SAG31_NODE_1261_length_9072_cov_39.512761_6_plen_160_part_00
MLCYAMLWCVWERGREGGAERETEAEREAETEVETDRAGEREAERRRERVADRDGSAGGARAGGSVDAVESPDWGLRSPSLLARGGGNGGALGHPPPAPALRLPRTPLAADRFFSVVRRWATERSNKHPALNLERDILRDILRCILLRCSEIYSDFEIF